MLPGPTVEPDRHPSAAAESPLGALRGPGGRSLRVAILSDFIRVPYANGAVFQTRFLYRQLCAGGHEVALVAAGDPHASGDELAPGTVALPSLPLRSYPGLRLPLPPALWELDGRAWDYDLVYAQSNSLLMLLGVWLRETKGTPLLCVNTTHLRAAYDVLLPPSLASNRLAHGAFRVALEPLERFYASIYNASDGLVVLSEGLRDYWRSRGVAVPVHVIPRAVQAEFHDAPRADDPYPGLLGPALARGGRLVCAGRHVREKAQDRVIRIFARHVLPREPGATLTMVGEGPDTEYYKRLARECGAGERVFFTGEVPFGAMPAWYAHADLFVHASLSETYGNVLGEALWCGCPVVAFADGMGVSAQVLDDVNGVLFRPGETPAEKEEGDEAMGRALVGLLRDPRTRTRFREAGVRISRARTSPRAVEQRIASAFLDARERAAALGLARAAQRSPAARWLTTARLFGTWWLLHLAISAAGCMRPGARRRGLVVHPRIWR